MSVTRMRQTPIHLGPNAKTGVRTQFGALCWRVRKDQVQIALVTSRRTKRWIIPKGWPADGATPAEAAAVEAREEAGLEGRVHEVCLGIYSYTKDIDPKTSLPCVVAVFPLKVKEQHAKWPEAGERRRKWFSVKKAASLVGSAELRRIILDFDPRSLAR